MGKGGVRRGGAARWGKPTTHALQGTLQYQVQMHRDKPGPGAYNVARSAPVGGGRFGSSIAKTGLEMIVYNKRGIPGPCAYGNPGAALDRPGGGKFSTAAVPSYIDLEVKRARDLPGPGQYSAAPKPQAGQSWGKSSAPSVMDVLVKNAAKLPAPGQYGNPSVSQISGGKWSTFHSKSDLDWIVYRASKLPAPGQYGNPSQSMIAGGRFGKSSVPGSVDLLQARARKLPGPGQYDVDYAYENTTFCNKNKLEDEMRAQRAATVLGGARSRPGTVLGSYKDRCDDLPSVRSDEHLEEGISQMMERYSRVSRATTSGGMGQGLFNPRNRSTRHIIGDFSDLEASGEIARPETVLSQAPPIGSAKRAAFLRRNLTPLHSG
eukprot:Tamp_11345.p1 GENE.Tamp_11345~~Tamp_11345.p1  ORF type:complete len:392 (+),score=62.52 Tamp_11345:46-1176(+)